MAYMVYATCAVPSCGREFKYPKQRGRKPIYCDIHAGGSGAQIMARIKREAKEQELLEAKRQLREQRMREYREQQEKELQERQQEMQENNGGNSELKEWEKDLLGGGDSTQSENRAEQSENESNEGIDLTRNTPFSNLGSVSGQHKMFPLLYALCMIHGQSGTRINPLLLGPAGSGKTFAAEMIAQLLELQAEDISCEPLMTKYDLLGYKDANGVFHGTPLTDVWENGGVILLDEIDASNSEVLVTINKLLSLKVGQCISIDGKRVPRHKDCIIIAGANTINGADERYAGRQQLDAATLNRFAIVQWDYDEKLEFEQSKAMPEYTSGMEWETKPTVESNDSDCTAWVNRVQRIRRVADDNKLPLLVTPRASVYGAEMLRYGIAQEIVEDLLIWNFTDPDTIRTAKANLRYGV